MFYISDEGMGGRWTVMDTDDMRGEVYTEEQLRSFGVEILGLYDDKVFVCRTPDIILGLLKSNSVSEAIKRMPYNYKFKVAYKTRPNGLGVVSHRQYEIERGSFEKYYVSDIGRGGKGMHTMNADGVRSFLLKCRQGDWVIDASGFGYSR